MLTGYDYTSILAYKMMKDYDLLKKSEFTKKYLSAFYNKVIEIVKDFGITNNIITDEHILEICDRLRDFCTIENGVITMNNKKGRKYASMYVQGMDYMLLYCCANVLGNELVEKDMQLNKGNVCD